MGAAAVHYVCIACGSRADAAGPCPRDGTERDATHDPLLGTKIGDYQLVAMIGEGGMGRVYRAIHPTIGAQVAVKVLADELILDPEMAERFIAEAKIANLVRHDGLVNVIGIGVLPDGQPYQIMEYLHGCSLGMVLHQRGRLPVGVACEVVLEALRALEPMHARGIVHRDLKPSNLFVTTAGRIKVIDFGIAKLVEHRGLTLTGQSLGTPQYMAPEQLEGEVVDVRADVYAMGVVLYEAIVGERPYEGREIEALAMRSTPPSVAALAQGAGDELDRVIARAMAPERKDRYADAAAMLGALEPVIAALPRVSARDLLEGVTLEPAPTPGESSRPTRDDRPPGEVDTVPSPVDGIATRPGRVGGRAAIEVGSRLGRYEVQGVIGQGSAGVVVIGFDPEVKRKVALKVLMHSDRPEQLRAEAQTMAKVAHPNVVTLYDLGEHEGALFLAMEYVEGVDLSQWLAAASRPWREVARMFAQAGRGLVAAHEAGVVHRDFKPSNVVIGDDARPRVGDFGIAYLSGEDGRPSGTAGYMAPEQLEGRPAEPASDQFAFCASLWEAVHGELPFAGETVVQIAVAARAGQRRAPRRETSRALDRVLSRGLAPTPAARFPSMRALVDELDTVVAARGSRWPLALAGLGAVSAATVITVIATRDHAAPVAPPPVVASPSTVVDAAAAVAAIDAATAPDREDRPDARLAAAQVTKPMHECFCSVDADYLVPKDKLDDVTSCRCKRAGTYEISQCRGAGGGCTQAEYDAASRTYAAPGLKDDEPCEGYESYDERGVHRSMGLLAECSRFKGVAPTTWRTTANTGDTCTGYTRLGVQRTGVFGCQ